MRRLIPLLLALAAPVAAKAGPDLSVAYHGDFLTHPGLAGRAGWTVAGGERTHLVIEAEVGMWWHPNHMVALYARTGPALRLDGPRNGTWGLFAHVGPMYGFWATPTYVVQDDKVTRGVLRGLPWFHVATGLELGRKTPSIAALDGWFVRPQVGFRIPTPQDFGIDLAVEAGVRF